MVRIKPSHSNTRISMYYANDSTEIDTTAGMDFVWAHYNINQYSSAKIGVFSYDYSGTYLSEIVDRVELETPHVYVQGMSGVNTRLSFTSLNDWILDDPIAISSATLIFDVVPEEESGIMYDDLPERLMLYTELDNGELEQLYDYVTLSNAGDVSMFGGTLKGESMGMFYDTTYTYQFNMGLHFQAMINGEKPDHNFLLQLYGNRTDPRISKLYSNLSANNKRIRLEIVYLKL
jgi:hypothetical protein